MYVILKLSWLQHPFVNSHFLIESESQIQKIVECGVKTVAIDTEKSKTIEDEISLSATQPRASVKQEVDAETPPKNPYEVKMEQSDLYQKISEVVGSKTILANEKAKAVQHLSLVMMSNLLKKPTHVNIAQAKGSISRIVDTIISDDEIAKNLLKITSHDFRTYTHSVTVGILGISLSKELFKGSDAHNLHEIGVGFFLHDIGKVNVDLAIINKPGKLTEDEMAVIRKHPEYGYQILDETKQLSDECKHVVLEHHERFDGTGYPYKLKGVSINLYGRICSIADVYEALTALRPYKNQVTPIGALKIMRDEMLQHFQRPLFEKFANLLVNR
jgi:HD-GYP domain-containing protein (c-di-GMP phosphodiesterase class II)